MYKIITTVLALAVSGSLWAQKPKFHPSQGALLDGKTIVKANLTSPIAHTYSFAVERILAKGLSLQLGVATMPKSGLPFVSSWGKLIDSDEVSIEDFRLGSFFITPELRWYTGGGYGYGFYMMAYYRYQDYQVSGYNPSIDLPHQSNGMPGRTVDLSLSGDLKTHSLGLGIGAQWLLGRNKNIVLDWNILGVHYGQGKLSLAGQIKQDDLSEQEVKDLREELSNTINEGPQLKVGSEDIHIDRQHAELRNVSTPWAFFRASLSIGFRF